MCSSPGGQLYEYNFWFNHSMLVAVRYADQDGKVFYIYLGLHVRYFLFFTVLKIIFIPKNLINFPNVILH